MFGMWIIIYYCIIDKYIFIINVFVYKLRRKK